MSGPDLHKFKDDLQNRPGPGSNAPPRTIRAKDLDENFKKVTVQKSDKSPKLYEVKYTKDGIIFTRLMPDGTGLGDLLYWNGLRWVVLPAVASSTMHVLTITNRILEWTSTEDC